MNPSKLLLAVPTRGQLGHNTIRALASICERAPGLPPLLIEPGGLAVTNVRNSIVKKFLASPAEYLFMVDDDVIPNPELLCLADEDKDILGSMYPIMRPPQYLIPIPCAIKRCPDHNNQPEIIKNPFSHSGLVKVDAIGTGAVCIARRVLEHPDLRIPFTFGTDDVGVMTRSEDVEFCLRAGDLGFEVWADFDRISDHMTTVSLLGIQDGYTKAYGIARRKELEASAKRDRPLIFRP